MHLKRIKATVVGLLCGLSWAARAYTIPHGLDPSDRQQIVSTLGLNSATKMLNNPYPLGGYSGFEIGYSMEFIDLRNIQRLGCAPGSSGCANTSYSDDTEWRFSRLTIGKGVFNDVDIFLHFVPPIGGVHIVDYGGALRWSFFEARFLPINVSFIGYFDQLNFQDALVNQNIGADLIVGVNVDNFALYFGGGAIQAAGRFTSATNGVCGPSCTVDSSDPTVDPNSGTVTTRVTATHTVGGVSIHFEDLFAAAQVDRYLDSVYSLKLGMRF